MANEHIRLVVQLAAKRQAGLDRILEHRGRREGSAAVMRLAICYYYRYLDKKLSRIKLSRPELAREIENLLNDTNISRYRQQKAMGIDTLEEPKKEPEIIAGRSFSPDPPDAYRHLLRE